MSWMRHFDAITCRFLPLCCVEYDDLITCIYNFLAKKYYSSKKYSYKQSLNFANTRVKNFCCFCSLKNTLPLISRCTAIKYKISKRF